MILSTQRSTENTSFLFSSPKTYKDEPKVNKSVDVFSGGEEEDEPMGENLDPTKSRESSPLSALRRPLLSRRTLQPRGLSRAASARTANEVFVIPFMPPLQDDLHQRQLNNYRSPARLL
jgi:hypothetical protein